MAPVNRRGIKPSHSPATWLPRGGITQTKAKAMNQIIVRNLDDEIMQRLKQIAWQEGRPPEEMARNLLIDAVLARTTRRMVRELEAHA